MWRRSVAAVVQVMAVMFGGCGGTPTSPSNTVGLFQGAHVLRIEASASCPLPGATLYPLPSRTVECDMVGQAGPDGTVSFREQAAPPANSTLFLTLRATGPSVVGMLSGGGACVDPLTLAREGVGVRPDPVLRGTVLVGADGRISVMGDPFAGTLSESLLFTAYGGDCAATDHGWSLRPR